MKTVLFAVLTVATVAPNTAYCETLCEKYGDDIRTLAGDGQIALAPLMSRPSGALDKSPPKEIGCQARMTPSDRGIVLGFAYPNYGADKAALGTKNNYVNAGLKPAPTPEPSLGTEGFSLLTTLGHDPKPNYLAVVGHNGPRVVGLTVHKGARSRNDLTNVEVQRGIALVRKALNAAE